MQELEEINESIDKYKSKSSSKRQTLSSADRKAAGDREGQGNPFFKRIQKSLKSKKSAGSSDYQMIPEKLPHKLSAASSRVSLKHGRKELEASRASESTSYKQQLSQVSLKAAANEKTNNVVEQASTRLDARILEE